MYFEHLNITVGPEDFKTGLPMWVEWQGERFYTPQFQEIEAWVFDSVCETLDGQRIEPDGVAHNGCPSWLLALGIM
jgi:hypothetical protein